MRHGWLRQSPRLEARVAFGESDLIDAATVDHNLLLWNQGSRNDAAIEFEPLAADRADEPSGAVAIWEDDAWLVRLGRGA